MNIQDEKDKIQLYIKNEIVGLDKYDKIVKKLDIGDIVGVSDVHYLELEQINCQLMLLLLIYFQKVLDHFLI